MRTPKINWMKFAAALAPLNPYGVFFGPDGEIYGPDGARLGPPTGERRPRATVSDRESGSRANSIFPRPAATS